MFEAEFWVAVAFVIFVGVLGYFGVHKLLLKGIDERRDRIKVEFDEARRLKAEAEALLAAYRRKQHEARKTGAEVHLANASPLAINAGEIHRSLVGLPLWDAKWSAIPCNVYPRFASRRPALPALVSIICTIRVHTML